MSHTATTDVNATFAAEKIAQLDGQRNSAASDNARRETTIANLRQRVANGEMTEKVNSDGTTTFKVIQAGWDKGETWTVQAAVLLDENGIVQANHGLDVQEDGAVSLYLNGDNGPAWHALGNVIPGGLSDTIAVLKAGGLLWDVEKHPDTYTNLVTGEIETLPGAFKTYRMDNGKALGRVGEIYTPLQNAEAYDMLTELIGLGMVCESAGSQDGGANIFVTAEIPEPLLIDPEGIADGVRQFLAIKNSHDGKSPLTAVVTPWRIVCRNTNRFASRDALYRWKIRHTRNAKNKMDEARRALGLTVQYYEAFAAEETSLVHTPVTSDDVEKLISELWEMKPGKDGEIPKRAVTISANRSEKIHEIFAMESERVGRNAFAAEQAITGYVDHYAELRPRGALKGNRLAALGAAIIAETFDDVKSNAHRKLLELRTR